MRSNVVAAGIFITAAALGQTPADLAKSSSDKLKAANSVSFTMLVTFPGTAVQAWKVQFLKPNLYKIISPDQEYWCDGKTETTYLSLVKQYQARNVSTTENIDAPFCLSMNEFFATVPPLNGLSGGSVQLDGKEAYRLAIKMPVSSKPGTAVFLDPQSDLPLGYDEPLQSGQTLKVRFADVRLNVPLEAASFSWSPPSGAKPLLTEDLGAKLLKPGEAAPTPTVADTNRAKLDLAKEFSTHRATVVYFCLGLPSASELASLKQLYAELSGQRLQVIVVAVNATVPAVQKNLTDLPFPKLADLNGDFAHLYGVKAASGFVIGPDGKVGASFLGYDADGIAKVLRLRGFRI